MISMPDYEHQRQLNALRDAIAEGRASGQSQDADDVFDRLESKYVAMTE